MPRYDFKCEQCGIVVELEYSMGEDRQPMCSGCNAPMARVWSATPAIFKGGGWGGQ